MAAPAVALGRRGAGLLQRVLLGTLLAILLCGIVASPLGSAVYGGTVPSSALTASIEASPRSGPVPLAVAFQGTAFGGTGTYVAYLWNFGDGGVASGATVQHRFNASGNFTVQLTIWDSTNDTAKASVQIAVGPPVIGSPPSGVNPFPTVDVTAAGVIVGGAVATGWVLRRWVVARRRDRGTLPTIVAPTTAPEVETPPDGSGEELYGGPFRPEDPPTDVSVPRAPRMGPVEPMGPSTTPTPVFVARRALAQRLLIELSTVPREWERSIAPALATQAGLAGRLGVQQSAISKVLRGLEAAGIVRSEIGHAHGASRRVRVYALTDRGERAARALVLMTSTDPGPPSSGGAPGATPTPADAPETRGA